MSTPDLDRLDVLLACGHAMVSSLCRRQGEPGWRRWVMSVPAQPEHDPDLVIGAALAAGDAAVFEARRLRDVEAKARAYIHAERRACDEGATEDDCDDMDARWAALLDVLGLDTP